MEDLPSTSVLVVDFDVEVCQPHHFLCKTTELVGLLAIQVPVLSLKGVDDLTIGEATILPLLSSIIHAMSTTGLVVGALCLQTCDLESRVTNFFADMSDHTDRLNQIYTSLHDVSHRVAHLLTPTTAPPSVVARHSHPPAKKTTVAPQT